MGHVINRDGVELGEGGCWSLIRYPPKKLGVKTPVLKYIICYNSLKIRLFADAKFKHNKHATIIAFYIH